MKMFLLGILTMYIITGIILEFDYRSDKFNKSRWIIHVYCWWIKILLLVLKPIVWLFTPIIHIRCTMYLIKWKCNPWSFTFRQLKELPYEARAGIIKYVPEYNKDILREMLNLD